MEIFVKMFYNKTLILAVEPADTIKNIKENVLYNENLPPENYILIFEGNILDDDRSLFDYNI